MSKKASQRINENLQLWLQVLKPFSKQSVYEYLTRNKKKPKKRL